MLVGACKGDVAERRRQVDAVARVGTHVVDAAVVEHLTREEGLDEDRARARAVDTLRLVAAAEAEGHGPKSLPPRRRERIDRAAKARLWLREIFEPAHGTDDIPADDPLIENLRKGFEVAREYEVATFCQVVVAPDPPPEGNDVPDEGFYRRAAAVYHRLSAFLTPLVPVGTDAACPTLRSLMRFVPRAFDEGIEVRYEAGGVDLGRCVQEAEDGTCEKPFLDPDWESAVAAAEAPSLLGPIRTRFGLHFVVLQDKLPKAPPSDPKVQAAMREAVLVPYRRRELRRTLERLRAARTVRIAPGVLAP
ncbi:MAG: peptidylprolyl isomerase [Deltaproteobacteria bacterium]|nr:MAG: peptidylprolyl isomerase [Deltaproteobacteria bacterium]